MSRELIELILPRLARRLNRQLRRYRSGQLDDKQFSQRFEELVQQQHTWLANKGYSELDAAVAVHGAVLVLSGPGSAPRPRKNRFRSRSSSSRRSGGRRRHRRAFRRQQEASHAAD